jgi:hypothetical protein
MRLPANRMKQYQRPIIPNFSQNNRIPMATRKASQAINPMATSEVRILFLKY